MGPCPLAVKGHSGPDPLFKRTPHPHSTPEGHRPILLPHIGRVRRGVGLRTGRHSLFRETSAPEIATVGLADSRILVFASVVGL